MVFPKPTVARLLVAIARSAAAVRNRITTTWCLATFGTLLDGARICYPARIVSPAAIHAGKNLFIGPGSHISVAELVIGDDFMSGPNLVILGGNHDLDPVLRLERISRPENSAPIVIGDNVWAGANVLILAGVTIGNNAVLAAGAVVTTVVEANTIVGGIPARPIGIVE